MKTKNILTLFAGLLLLAFISSCSKDLPYDLDAVKRGALIDITKLSDSPYVANVKVNPAGVQIGVLVQMVDKGAGDYAYVQLTCRYLRPSTGDEMYVVVKDNITTLPQNIDVDYAALLASAGITPLVGDRFYFTTNVVLKDGTVIQGYNPETGRFNNTTFSGYLVGTRGYSSNVLYNVVP